LQILQFNNDGVQKSDSELMNNITAHLPTNMLLKYKKPIFEISSSLMMKRFQNT